MNLKQLLTEYRGYELRCVGKQIPLSFRQWVHNEYDMPNLTMEGLVQALVNYEDAWVKEEDTWGVNALEEYRECSETVRDLTIQTREMEQQQEES